MPPTQKFLEMAYFDARLRYSDVLYYLNRAKREVLKENLLGFLGRPPRPPRNTPMMIETAPSVCLRFTIHQRKRMLHFINKPYA